MLTTGVLEFSTSRSSLVRSNPPIEVSGDRLPGLPVLPETVLALELQLQHSFVDVSSFAGAVLSDLGATLQVLRLAGQEYGTDCDRFLRVEDCICDFGPSACLDAIATGSLARGFQRRVVGEVWTHSRQIAATAQRAAENIAWTITPDQAYTAGLLHPLGSLPNILGWDLGYPSQHRVETAIRLAEEWSLPGYLCEFFRGMRVCDYGTEWTAILAEAHRLAGFPDVPSVACGAPLPS